MLARILLKYKCTLMDKLVCVCALAAKKDMLGSQGTYTHTSLSIILPLSLMCCLRSVLDQTDSSSQLMKFYSPK
jgi:hypothetical protein